MEIKLPKLIGITGKIGSGKTESEKILKRLGYRSYILSEPIKKIGLILQFEEKQLFGSQKEKQEINEIWNISGREFLQKFGTDICRDLLPNVIPSMKDIWIKLLDINRKQNPHLYYLIPDVRFPDEANYIKQNGGIIIKIIREIPDQLSSSSEHSSETQNVQEDYIIHNNGTLEDLYINLVKVLVGSSR